MPRFVILQHDSPRGLHWDFMLETGSVLATWALPLPPNRCHVIKVEALPDHRPTYLDCQGPISGDRGSVTRWDGGTYQVEHQSDSELVVMLAGEKVSGRVVIERLPDKPNQWRFSFGSLSDR